MVRRDTQGDGVRLTSAPIDWYAARAGGAVAYVLLTAAVLLGLRMAGRTRSERWPRLAVEDLHRYAGLLAGAFIAVHVVTIAIDSYLPFSVTSLVVPFVARYRPAWIGLGIVAAELLVALAVTNRLRRRRLSYRAWRRAHYLNFAAWGTATLHGLGSGTDRSQPWLLAIMLAATGAVLTATAWRLARRRRIARPSLLALPAGAAGVAVLLPLVLGPLQFRPRPWDAARFNDTLTAQISRQPGATRGIISLAGSGTGDQAVLVRADLLETPARLLDTDFQMEYLPSGARCRGTVTRIDSDGLGFAARCHLGNGHPRAIAARWLASAGTELQGATITATS